MPSSRPRRVRTLSEFRITETAVEAFKSCDDDALRQALGLKPWQFPTFPDKAAAGTGRTAGDMWADKAKVLKAALERQS
jgi:hypothetical protein